MNSRAGKMERGWRGVYRKPLRPGPMGPGGGQEGARTDPGRGVFVSGIMLLAGGSTKLHFIRFSRKFA